MLYRLVYVVLRVYIDEPKRTKKTVHSVCNITFWLIFFTCFKVN